ncbi:hypothetical protein GCM10027343_06920 [Noviherbaspirillum agri]
MQVGTGLNAKDVTSRDFITLSDVLSPILAARKEICIVTGVIMSITFVSFLLVAEYKSQGFIQFGGAIPMLMGKEKEKEREKDKENNKNMERAPGISLSDFKRYAAAYTTSERFEDYVQDKNLADMEGVKDLSRVFSSRQGISQNIEPVYPFTKLDAKELMEQPKGSSNNVIGLRINYQARSPEIAQKMVGVLGNYAMDSIIYFIFSDMLRFKHDEIQVRITELENVIITKKVELEEYRRRVAYLKQIIDRNPIGRNDVPRQVVTITEDSAKYLPPATLLMTTEVQTVEANEAIIKAKREQMQYRLLLEYYDGVKARLDETKSGEKVLRSLEGIKASVFKDKNLEDDIVKEVYNMITVDNQDAVNLYLEKSRFIAGPTLPNHSTVRKGLVLAMGFVMGLLLSILFVFTRNWTGTIRPLSPV